MKERELLYGVVGFLIGIFLTLIFVNLIVNTNQAHMMGIIGIKTPVNQLIISESDSVHESHDTENMKKEMNAMVSGLTRKTGDEFDKSFLSEMIIHHEGAIEMAQMLKKNTVRPELLQLADEIINTQTKEVQTMREWQDNWFKKGGEQE